MAVAVAGEGESKFLMTRLERRISASQRAWEAGWKAIAAANPDFTVGQPVNLERKAGRWMVTETMCVWLSFRPTIMPLSDVIKVIATREMVDDPNMPAPGTVYLTLDRMMTQSAVAELVSENGVEYLRLQGFPPEEVEELLLGASKSFPANFNPDG